MKRLFLFPSLLSALLLLSACSFSLAADITPPPGYQPPPAASATAPATAGPIYPLVPPDPAKGEAIYAENCAPCHGETGLGDGSQAIELPNPAIAIGAPEIARQATPAEWFKVVTQGNLQRFMPPFPSLTDRQRWDVVAYVFSLSAPPERLLAAAETYQANCAPCHGEQGRGDGPQAGGMALPDFSSQGFMAGKSAAGFYQVISQGAPPAMPGFAQQLSETERWALADFLRSLVFTQTQARPQGQETPALEGTTTSETAAGDMQVTAVISDASSLGQVSGMLTNASGGEAPSGLDMVLHAFDQMQVVLTTTTSLQDGGSYVFENVEMPEGRAFLVTVEYDGVTYGSQIAVAEAGQTGISLYVEVYDSTSDTALVSVDRVHYFFESVGDGVLRIVELYIISNLGSETLAAAEEGQPVLEFQLPPEAANLEFEDGSLGGRYILTENGFGDTLPIRPGESSYQILYSYEMPYDNRLELARPMQLATRAVVILVPEDGIKVKGEGIQDAGARDVQGVQYHMYSGGSLAAGDELRLTISGRPQSSPTVSAGASSNLFIGLGALGAALLVAGFWLYQRSRPAGEQEEDLEHAPAAWEPQDAETIMDAILALDDLFQAGQLPEEAYVQRRNELRQRLKAALEHGS
ncbi:MAG: c-type cytochrome [Anaerolineales bacterium]|nr:c-type cytochrome [Anaerolineales bacterium]